MGDEDDYRVEARLAGASRGISPTTEQIQTLLQRQRTHEQLTRPPPHKLFAQVLREQGGPQAFEIADTGAPKAPVPLRAADSEKTEKNKLQVASLAHKDAQKPDALMPGRVSLLGFRHARSASPEDREQTAKQHVPPPKAAADSAKASPAAFASTNKRIFRG